LGGVQTRLYNWLGLSGDSRCSLTFALTDSEHTHPWRDPRATGEPLTPPVPAGSTCLVHGEREVAARGGLCPEDFTVRLPGAGVTLGPSDSCITWHELASPDDPLRPAYLPCPGGAAASPTRPLPQPQHFSGQTRSQTAA